MLPEDMPSAKTECNGNFPHSMLMETRLEHDLIASLNLTPVVNIYKIDLFLQVKLDNGSTVTLRQRERPHLVFDSSGNPIALTNGAGWLDDCDHVFTFAQKIHV